MRFALARTKVSEGGNGVRASARATSMSSKVAPSSDARARMTRQETKLELDPALQSSKKKDGNSIGNNDNASSVQSNPPYVQTRDKVMFLISVLNVIILSHLVGGFQWLMPYYYTMSALPLLFLRFWTCLLYTSPSPRDRG